MEDKFQAEIIAACNALGTYENDRYLKEPDCTETIKDLMRYLKRDDENHEIRRLLGQTQLLQNDLIHIIEDYSSNKELFELTLRLVMNLTTPALVLWEEQLPEEKVTRSYYQEVIYYLQQYKLAFSKEKIWSALGTKLAELLDQPSDIRLAEDNLLVERILILVRNILHISPAEDDSKRTDDDNSLHDRVIWALHRSGVEDLLLYLATSDQEHHLCLHVLEIISLIFKEQDPKLLASTGEVKSLNQKKQDEEELQAAILRERELKQNAIKKSAMRHSRFGGTYSVKNMKSISDNDLVYHKPLEDFKNLTWDANKAPKKIPKNKLPKKTEIAPRRSTFAIRVFLKEFCFEFLNGAYNSLMYSVKDNLVRARSQENDETYYLWAIRFFMEFNRHYKYKINYVSETMSIQNFHYIQTQLQHHHERLVSEKNETHYWAGRMHLSVKAYQELLLNLIMMDNSSDSEVRKSSRIIKENLFYVVEYREMCLVFLLNYSETKLSREYLRDLIETCHIFLKLLEKTCKMERLMVQKKVRKHTKKRSSKKSSGGELQNLNPTWESLQEDLCAMIQTNETLENELIPFDASLDIAISEQKNIAKARIQNFLLNKKLYCAVGLLRNSRDVWPGEEFGDGQVDCDTELKLLRNIFNSELEDKDKVFPSDERFHMNSIESEHETDDDEEPGEYEGFTMAKEQEFNLQEFLQRFLNHKIVENYCLLLSQFQKNSKFTNHCIVKMLHRISFDLKMHGMLFQASAFRTFQKILKSPEAKASHFKEIVQFVKYIIEKFVKAAKKNPKIYFEILFWKTVREGCELEEGYGSFQSVKGKSLLWTEDQEFELSRLYEEFKDIRDGENDVIDHIMNSLIDDTKSRRMILRKLKEMGLIDSSYNVKQKASIKGVQLSWGEEETNLLKQLWNEFKDSSDPMIRILERLKNAGYPRTRSQVVHRLLELELIQDRKETRKKKASKSKKKRQAESESDDETNFSTGVTEVSKSNHQKTTQNYVRGVSGSLTDQAKKLKKMGFEKTLQWIAISLLDAAENDSDESDDDDEDVPLVPFDAEHSDSLKCIEVQQFLQDIDIRPPADEQETNWRIKACVDKDGLNERAAIISRVVDNEDLSDDNETNEDESLLNTQLKSVSVVDHIIESSEQGSRKKKYSTSDSDEEGLLGMGRKRKVIKVQSDSESEGESRIASELINTATGDKIDLDEVVAENQPPVESSEDSDEEITHKRRVRMMVDSDTD